MIRRCFVLIIFCLTVLESFKIRSTRNSVSLSRFTLRCQESGDMGSESMPSDVESATSDFKSDGQLQQDILSLKNKLFALAAVCDRGFGALPSDREAIDDTVNQLRDLYQGQVPTLNLYPNNSNHGIAPLEGNWKLVYTTALDVLSLASSPFTLLQGIYQSIKKDGSSVNVIDVAPRIQAAFPSSLVGLGSTLRLKVFTSAFARSDTRVGLTFRRVEAAPLSLFGQSVVNSFLPTFKANLPQATLFGSNMGEKGIMGEDQGPGYFDVVYLDHDCLIIAQNAPGGIFISVRDDARSDFF